MRRGLIEAIRDHPEPLKPIRSCSRRLVTIRGHSKTSHATGSHSRPIKSTHHHDTHSRPLKTTQGNPRLLAGTQSTSPPHSRPTRHIQGNSHLFEASCSYFGSSKTSPSHSKPLQATLRLLTPSIAKQSTARLLIDIDAAESSSKPP